MSIRERASARPDLDLYTRASRLSTARVIRTYSSSFGLASRLLDRGCRPDVEAIYGLVRIADEIVDGAAEQAGLDVDAQHAILDGLEHETAQALVDGYSANPIVHAFAVTARSAGIEAELTEPFFASMRRDLSPVAFDRAEFTRYVYGSAEVVGLMCLRVFLRDVAVTPEGRAELELGARHLGAAFQKVNFLRDLASDWNERGRGYLPGVDPSSLDDAAKNEMLDEIDADLEIAARSIPHLPAGCRPAIAAAALLFGELSQRIRRTPAEQLLTRRVRVSNGRKLAIVAAARMGALPGPRS